MLSRAAQILDVELTLGDEDVMTLEEAFPIGPDGPLAIV